MMYQHSEKTMSRIIFCGEHYDFHIKSGGNTTRWVPYLPVEKQGHEETWRCDYNVCPRVAVIIERTFGYDGVQR